MKKNMCMIFRKIIFLLFLILLFGGTAILAQENGLVWIKVEKGHVLFLSPSTNEWIPCNAKEKISSKTYILTKDNTRASFFLETEKYDLPSNSYFFGSDIINRNRLEIVSALTHIEAEQLPENNDNHKDKITGMIYGDPNLPDDNKTTIPYEVERVNAVNWFVNNNYYSAALLSLKRMFIRYPQAYSNETYVEQLFSLYDWFKLYGFLRTETEMLLKNKLYQKVQNSVLKWSKYAHKKLSEQ